MASESEKNHGLLIVSNRRPLSIEKVNGRFEIGLLSGGRVAALSVLTDTCIVEGDCIRLDGHPTSVGSFVAGIDPQRFADCRKDPSSVRRIQELEETFKDKTVSSHPELKRSVILIQVAVPSRQGVKEHRELEAEVSTLLGDITFVLLIPPDGVLLIYMHHSESLTELTAL
ncbi:hypothetical protein E8E15_001851 [Penicillium rubens]|nr:hypothetical protein E8E15_001851 [Penicillium rubens]